VFEIIGIRRFLSVVFLPFGGGPAGYFGLKLDFQGAIKLFIAGYVNAGFAIPGFKQPVYIIGSRRNGSIDRFAHGLIDRMKHHLW
jgi:hypothetical protein